MESYQAIAFTNLHQKSDRWSFHTVVTFTPNNAIGVYLNLAHLSQLI
ncbi:MAG: hypothetical protein KAF91_07770 [Nostoc sp. TH1S01]|nr:hypothetical protein [Nostoc sp. TH1S01]